jgi:hypothetical protein
MEESYKEELMSDDNIRNCKKMGCGLFRRNGVDRKELWEMGYDSETASSMPSHVHNLFPTVRRT